MQIAGEKILIVGDSLSHPGSDSGPEASEVTASTEGPPGTELGRELLQNGAAAVRIDARVGRSAINFWGREDTGRLLAADYAWKPTKVIVMLGTNDLGADPSRDAAAFSSLRDAYASRGAEVWAIGPPTFGGSNDNARAPDVVSTMRAVFGNHFVDARPLTADLLGPQFRTGDGVHFQHIGASVFGQRLLPVIAAAGQKAQTATYAIGGAALLAAALLVWAHHHK